MGTNTTATEVRKDLDKTLNDLEQLADEVRLKIHLAELDVRDAWATKLEPRLFEARVHAREATAASKASIEATIKAFREFAQGI